jgi:hypothetical protein
MGETARLALPRWAALLINIVGYQAGWTACVLFAARGLPLAGVTVAAGLLLLHLLLTPAPRRDLLLALLFGAVGFVADTLLGLLGVLHHGGTGAWAWLAPPWLVAIWALFATTIHVTFAWLMGRPLLAAVLGAVAGAAAYLGGARLGAVTLGLSEPAAAAAIALEWALAFPLLLVLARRIEARRLATRYVAAASVTPTTEQQA